jgi:formate C-acetyltransferase
MFELRPVTTRVRKLRDKYRNTIPSVDAERTRIVTEYYKKSRNIHPSVRRATTLYEILSQMTVRVEEDELIAGNMGKYYHNCIFAVEYNGLDWIADELKSGAFDRKTAADGLAFMDAEDRAYVCDPEVIGFWRENDLSALLDANLPDGFDAVSSADVLPHRPDGSGRAPHGHFNVDYKKALEKGFGAIRLEALARLEALRGEIHGNDAGKYYFYKSIVISCDAMCLISKRYGAECRRQAAETADLRRRAELLSMADSFEWIVEHPVRTFHEALQVLLLYHFALAIEGSTLGISIGRIDQHTIPYLEADLKAGRLTISGAQELMDCFFLKLGEFCLAGNAGFIHFIGAYSNNQRLTISGRKKDGTDATNDATYLCLQSGARLKLHDPTLSLCLHKDSPAALWEAGIETVKIVGGIPTFENTDLVISLLHARGLPIEEARNFCVIGCVEMSGSGCEFSNVSGPYSKTFFNVTNVVLQAIGNGVNPLNGKKGGLETGYLYEMKSFEEVRAAFEKQLRYFLDWHFTIGNVLEYIGNPAMPIPVASATMDGCMENGRDMALGGARYNSTGSALIGIATAVDSLAAIKYLVYDEKVCSARELYDAILTNWEGKESLRQAAVNCPHRFGNGDAEADGIAGWVSALYTARYNSYIGPRGQHRAGMYSAGINLVTGYITAATPNGRKAHDVVSDGGSPTHGADACGPTGVVRSVLALHPENYPNGIQFCMRFHPSCVQGAEGVKKLTLFTETFFEEGGMQLQINVVDAATLRAAQESPEEHRDLVVRVAGFSAYFIELYKDLQDDIIKRTDNML